MVCYDVLCMYVQCAMLCYGLIMLYLMLRYVSCMAVCILCDDMLLPCYHDALLLSCGMLWYVMLCCTMVCMLQYGMICGMLCYVKLHAIQCAVLGYTMVA